MRLGLRKPSVGVSSLSLWQQSHSLLMYRSKRNKSFYALAPSFFHLKIVKPLPTVSHSLPLPRSFREICKAWWSKSEDFDGDAVSPQVKLWSLFRGLVSRHVSCMYESPDNLLSLDAPTAPSAGYPCLPKPQKKLEIDERDVRFLESSARLALSVSIFSEVVLQSLENDFHLRTRSASLASLRQ